MYPKAERERILSDLAASGLSMRGYSRIPGNPSLQSLTAWRRQAEAGELDVPERRARGACEHSRHARYPKATRREALSLLGKGMRPCDVARRLGVESGGTVSSWRRSAERAKMAPKGAMAVGKGGCEGLSRKELEERVREAEMQNAVLRELMRDPKAGDPRRLSNRRKAELGERLRRGCGCSLKEVLAFFRMPKSTYEYERRAMTRPDGLAWLRARVREEFEASGRAYGYRRVHAAIALGAGGRDPERVSEKVVRRVMREQGMVARRSAGRGAYSSYAGEPDERPANAPLRAGGAHDFRAARPGELAVTDVTEFKVGGAKAYLSPIIDCFDGLPAAWSVSAHPDSRLCDSSLLSYLAALPQGHPPLTAHSDGGGPYRASSWKRICEENGVARSMSRKGCCQDNARAEGFFGTLKEEFYNGRDWAGASLDGFASELGAYIEWYRDGRLKAFREGDRTVYDTIMGRRRRLGYAV